jgi:hypothetical protein
MFTIDTESGFGRGLHHVELRPGRNGGAGRREPGRVLRLQADAASGQVPDHPPLDRLEADQDGIHEAGRSWPREDRGRAAELRNRYSITDDDVAELARTR